MGKDMDVFDEARAVYAEGKLLVDALKHRTELDDHARWLMEDFEDALLDLKEAVIQINVFWAERYTLECRGFAYRLRKLL